MIDSKSENIYINLIPLFCILQTSKLKVGHKKHLRTNLRVELEVKINPHLRNIFSY